MFDDGEIGKYPNGLAIFENQLHKDYLYNLVEDCKEAGGTLEFTVMTKVTVRINSANGDKEVVRKKRTYA